MFIKKIMVGAVVGIALTSTLVGCGGDSIEISSIPVESTLDTTKPVLKVYLENSGSMDGYMCDGSQLKDAIFSYVSDLNNLTDTTELYYLNNQAIPFKHSLEQYIKTLNPASFKAAGGNRANSDLSSVLKTVLSQVSDSTVCIFVSDCILDLPVADSQKFLNTAQISIKNSINEARKRVPNLGVEILKMSSDFEGKYFYQNGGVEQLADVKRPYYIWIFGNCNVLANLNKQVQFSSMGKYGYESSVIYATRSAVPYKITNKSTTSNTIKPIKGEYIATLQADFGTTLQQDDVIANVSNYAFNNKNIYVENIQAITAKGSPYTHTIAFVIPKGVKIAEEELSFNMPSLPNWVEESNDDTGKDIKNNLNKTTGIKYLISGVADSYKTESVLTSFKFNVKRK